VRNYTQKVICFAIAFLRLQIYDSINKIVTYYFTFIDITFIDTLLIYNLQMIIILQIYRYI